MTRANTNRPICIGGEDAKFVLGTSRQTFHLSFTTLCDGFVDRYTIDGLNYTDEMDCKEWVCNNIYTRCDGKWNCPNAVDEANCSTNLCHPDGHLCMSPYSNNFTCLPLARINDGHIDCIGGYDEQYRCGNKLGSNWDKNYRCFNETNCIHIYR
ncbi:unnamed protein product, partial [Rotaria sp. Silwood1]